MRDLIAKIRAGLARAGDASSDFDLNSGIKLPEDRILRAAGVLVAVIWREEAWHVVLTKR